MENHVKILIVDDDEISREILQDAIEQPGVEIGLASDGVEGLEKLATQPFDILITDLNMPRMDGLTLLREARQRYPHILTIIITGYGSLESAIEAIRQGTYDYIQKPFKIEEMTVTTRNAIEKIRILREKNRIFEELELAYRKLHKLEAESSSKQAIKTPESSEERLASFDSLYLFPRHTLPLSLFEKPAEGTARVLTELERLNDLRQKGLINTKEFESLKRIILDKMDNK